MGFIFYQKSIYTYKNILFVVHQTLILQFKAFFMDNKITLSFDEDVIKKAKKYAENNNISLSRLIEFLLQKITSSHYVSLEDFPISEWVNQVAEGEAVYQTKGRTRKSLKKEYFDSKK